MTVYMTNSHIDSRPYSRSSIFQNKDVQPYEVHQLKVHQLQEFTHMNGSHRQL